MDSDNFKFVEANLKYNDCYKRATIIMERVVKLETLEDTFIPEVFKERTWTLSYVNKFLFSSQMPIPINSQIFLPFF